MQKILILQANEDVFHILQYLLEAEGYLVLGYNYLLPLGYVEALEPDILLIQQSFYSKRESDDYLWIKTNAKTGHIPVILISAHRYINNIEFRLLADGQTAEPFGLSQLVKTINGLLK